ncbi:MAG: V-type ATPase subunit [Clostridia bacterium]|nr:V-type ATPase subunit [Clostridia bacterium]
MPQPSIPFACGRLSALEAGLLDQQAVKRMADGTLEDAMRMLQDAHYGDIPDATSADVERMIDNVRVHTAQELREISPKPAITDLFLLRTDIQNLKMLIKARLTNETDTEMEAGGLFEPDQLRKMVSDQSYKDFPEDIADAVGALERDLKTEVNPQHVSVALDRAYLAHAQNTAKKEGDPFARTYFDALCDFDNMITFLRMRATGAPKEALKEVALPTGGIRIEDLAASYELTADSLRTVLTESPARDAIERGLAAVQTTGSIAALERERDDYLLSLVKDHKYDALTMYPIYGYYFAREREAKAVRLILTVKRNGLDDAVIQERLCELYG